MTAVLKNYRKNYIKLKLNITNSRTKLFVTFNVYNTPRHKMWFVPLFNVTIHVDSLNST